MKELMEKDILKIMASLKPEDAAKKIAEYYFPKANAELNLHPKANEILARIRLHTKNHKVKSGELERQYGIGGEALREQVINPLRQMGEFICSEAGPDGGYWYGTAAEAEECAMILKARSYKAIAAANGMIRTVSSIDQNLFGESF